LSKLAEYAKAKKRGRDVAGHAEQEVERRARAQAEHELHVEQAPRDLALG
jgi:hypothetical protein